MIDFFAPCVPPTTTSQMKRVNMTTGRFFKGKNQLKAVATLEGVFLPHRPKSPVRGIVSLTIEATWPWRKSDLNTKAKRLHAETVKRIPHGSKPDADNFAKQALDCLASLYFIEKDELVAELIVRKWFGEEPGIRVVIREIDTVPNCSGAL